MSTVIIAAPSEAAHWYTITGEACHTVIGANGRERPTTLRDARKQNLYPSVTSVLAYAARPGLERWKREQVLLSALTLKRNDDEPERDWLRRVIEDSEAQAAAAAAEGTRIHGALQQSFENKPFDLQYMPHVTAVRQLLLTEYGDIPWATERSFAHRDGFGGCSDLHHGSLVIDFKGKEFEPGDVLELFDEHPCQLAAYAYGLGLGPNPEGAIVFVSRNHPGLVQLVPCPAADMLRGLRMFRSLLAYWQAKTGWRPQWHDELAA